MKTSSHSIRATLAVVMLVTVAAASTVFAQTTNIPGVGQVVKKTNSITNAIDINTAPQSTLAAISTIGPQVAQAIITERGKGQFKDAQDFAARMCSKTSVNFEDTSIVIAGTPYAPRGGNPKDPGWKCVMGEKHYSYRTLQFGFRFIF
jgi:Helix-hairpin-helix motif